MIASPNELRYFIELAHTLNFSRAATRIGISQPSLSTAIKRLEHAIGTELFIRNKHKVILTQAGKNLLTHTKQLLQLWDTTKATCLASEQTLQGNLRIGCHSSVALYFLPRFLPQLVKQYSKLDIQLKHDLSRKITEEVINLSIDLGIAVNPIKHPDLIIKKLFDDQVTCWKVKQIDTTKDNIIICDPELIQTQWILKRLEQNGIPYKRIISSSNLEVITQLTIAGVGIGILPSCVAMFANNQMLERVPNAPLYEDDICLIYRHENRHHKVVQVAINAIKRATIMPSQNAYAHSLSKSAYEHESHLA